MRRMNTKTQKPAANPLVGDFIEHIREAMRDKGVTQTQLAEALGIGQSAVSKMLDGSDLTFGTAIKIAQAIDIQVSFLFSDHSGL